MLKPTTVRQNFLLSSTLESVTEAEAATRKLAIKTGLNEDECYRLALAVREAVANAVLHGNESDPAKKITIRFEINGEAIIVAIADQGKGLNLEAIPDPLAAENILRGSGREIFLIRSFVDALHVQLLHPGTELTLVKYLLRPPKSIV
jgi:serine/threonine-protein kinase RsbW